MNFIVTIIIFILYIKVYVLNACDNVCYIYDIFPYYIKDCINERPVKNNLTHIIWNETVKDSSQDNYKEMENTFGLNGLYRPRSALARALYEKQRNDGHLRDIDKNEVRKTNSTLTIF